MAKIVGREEEINELNERYSSDHAELIVVYGRRRVGKTFMIRETFRNKMTFYHTGLSPYDEKRKIGKKEQLEHFYHSLLQHGMAESTCPKTWMQAFYMLEELLEDMDDGERQLVFIDELPWLDTPGSGFVTAFEAFWNGWASARDNMKCVVCGSATSWIMDNMIDQKGGLYDRQTSEVKLEPFTLNECELFFDSRGIDLSRFDIAEAYMAVGGIPYYLDKFSKGLSLAQNIDRLMFNRNARLRNEFERLFGSLFVNPELYMKTVRLLATKHCGFTRDAISKGIDMKGGAGLTKMLKALEASNFIQKYRPFDATHSETLYRLTDPFCRFWLRFVEGQTKKDEHFWQHNQNLPALNAWRGIAFEELCLMHVEQVKYALGVSGIVSTQSEWTLRGDSNHDGAQMDMIIERADRVVNLCEIKCCNDEFEIDKSYDLTLRHRINMLQSGLQKTQNVHMTFITTFGVKKNKYSSIVQKEVTLDDLFR